MLPSDSNVVIYIFINTTLSVIICLFSKWKNTLQSVPAVVYSYVMKQLNNVFKDMGTNVFIHSRNNCELLGGDAGRILNDHSLIVVVNISHKPR